MPILKNLSSRAPDASRSVARVVLELPILQFEKMVELFPGNRALQDHERALDYRTLNATANCLARIIIEKFGSGPDAPVVILLDHDSAAIVTVLAILKAARPYLSLHPANPPQRMQTIFSDARPAGVVSLRRYQSIVDGLSDGEPARALYLDDIDLGRTADNPGLYPQLEDPFGIFYTSGTTGEPQGLVLSHRFVSLGGARHNQQWNDSPADRSSLLGSISFSAAPRAMMTPLTTGGALYVFDFKTFGPEQTRAWIAAQEITMLGATPSMFRAIFENAPAEFIVPSLRLVSLGGEQAKRTDFEIFKRHTGEHCSFVHVLASTEAGTLASLVLDHRSAPTEEYLPAGYPIAEKEVLILDPHGRPVKPGEEGEIVVKGSNLSSGFWNRPELTAEKFLVDPDDPERRILYTGDLGAWRADGMLEFRGRKDAGVKIRGFRVDLSEIESTLHTHPLIKEAVVVVRPAQHRPDQFHLIAYVVARGKDRPTISSLRQYVSARLPDYSIPAFFVFLDRLPLNTNDKVDLQNLPGVPERPELASDDLPSDAIEKRLVEIWTELLHIENLSVQDNFFEVGGDSLLVLSMTLEVENAFGRSVPRAFFDQPTLNSLANLLREQIANGKNSIRELDQQRDRQEGDPAWRRQVRRLKYQAKVARLGKRLRKLGEGAFVFEWFLAQLLLHLSFQTVRRLIFWIADQPSILSTVYAGRQILFRSFLESLGILPEQSANLFRLSFINNLMQKVMRGKRSFRRGWRRKNGRPAPAAAYAQDIQRLTEDTPLDQVDGAFPVEGLGYLQESYREGHGVILLSIHGTALNSLALRVLSRRLSSPRIQAIAQNARLIESSLKGISKDQIPSAMAAARYSEVAYEAQALLQKGGIIYIMADFDGWGPGQKSQVEVGNRGLWIKTGFADLALNTGAKVIPVYGRFLEDGRLQTRILAPLGPGNGSREEMTDAFIQQYTDFINSVLKLHPEMLYWDKIRKYFRQKRIHPPVG